MPLSTHANQTGTFGKVRLGTHIMTGEKVGIKILEKSRIVEPADVQRVKREIGILKRVRHKNVIQLFEVIDTPRQIFLIMECVQLLPPSHPIQCQYPQAY